MKITRHSLLSKSDTFVSKHVVENDTHIVRITLTDGRRPDSDIAEDRLLADKSAPSNPNAGDVA